MYKLSSAALVVAVCALFGAADRSHAGGVPCCGCEIQWVEKCITCYRSEVRTRDVVCTVQKQVCREVCETTKVVIPHPYTETQTRDIYVYKPKHAEVTREIYTAVECPACEGCGCGHGCCKPTPANYKQTIKCVECQPDSEKVTITETVCKVRTEEKLVPTKKVIVETVPETVVKHESYCVQVPYQFKVCVPVCVPCGCGH